jgi:hypothetical protein
MQALMLSRKRKRDDRVESRPKEPAAATAAAAELV